MYLIPLTKLNGWQRFCLWIAQIEVQELESNQHMEFWDDIAHADYLNEVLHEIRKKGI